MIEVYRYRNHVYLPTQKNASTFYRRCFIAMGWETVIFEDVKSNTDIKFFSYIQNPDVRHTKGIAELIKMLHGRERRYPRLIKKLPYDFLATIICSGGFDGHSMPITYFWQEVLDRIHWIPIDLTVDGQSVDSETLTNDYLAEHDLPLLQTDGIDRHASNYILKNWQIIVAEQKKRAREIGPLSDSLFNQLDRDTMLYFKVINSYRDKLSKAK